MRKTAGAMTSISLIISQVKLLTPLSKLVISRRPTMLLARAPK